MDRRELPEMDVWPRLRFACVDVYVYIYYIYTYYIYVLYIYIRVLSIHMYNEFHVALILSLRQALSFKPGGLTRSVDERRCALYEGNCCNWSFSRKALQERRTLETVLFFLFFFYFSFSQIKIANCSSCATCYRRRIYIEFTPVSI